MVSIFIADKDIRIKTPYKTLVKKTEGNIDELVRDVLAKCNDANIEVVTWLNRYEMVRDNPRNQIEKEISDILKSKNVVFRKFSNEEWKAMKKQIKGRIFDDVVSEQEKKSTKNKEQAFDPFA